MIENLTDAGVVISQSDFRSLLVLSHWRMRPLRDERVVPGHTTFRQNFRGEREQQVGVVVAGLVRNDGEHARARRDMQERLPEYLAQLRRRKIAFGRPFAYKGGGAVGCWR